MGKWDGYLWPESQGRVAEESTTELVRGQEDARAKRHDTDGGMQGWKAIADMPHRCMFAFLFLLFCCCKSLDI